MCKTTLSPLKYNKILSSVFHICILSNTEIMYFFFFGSVYELTLWYWGQNIKQSSEEGYSEITSHAWYIWMGIKSWYNK